MDASWMRIGSVALGGALGAVARYTASGWVQGLTSSTFPWGTLAVNLVGSFVLGALLEASTGRFLLSIEARLLWTTGFCGALTTYSTFSYETLRLLENQQWAAAGGNAALNLAGTLLAVWLGVTAARMV